MAKSKWDYIKSRFPEIIIWLNKGLCEGQIIKNLAISKTTFEKYKKEQSALVELLKKGTENQVEEVENSLYKNATGFYYYVTESIKLKNPDGSERVETVEVKKFKSPETAAICFFLKNKDKANYTDNPQLVELHREEFKFKKEQQEKFGSW
jgi:hypothetical protein